MRPAASFLAARQIFANLVHKTVAYNNMVFEELQNHDWRADLYFITDLMGHINELNKSLQGKENMVFTMYNSVKAFRLKLNLFYDQLLKLDFAHFPTSQEKIKINKNVYKE